MLWITFLSLLVIVVIAVGFQGCDGKTAEEWKGRIIYQVVGLVGQLDFMFDLNRYTYKTSPFYTEENLKSIFVLKRDKRWDVL